MDITVKECKGAEILGVCSDGLIFNGRRSLLRFCFVWNKDSKEFSSLSEGLLDDECGIICRFGKRNGWDEREFIEPVREEFEKTLSDTLAVLRVNLTNDVVSRVY